MDTANFQRIRIHIADVRKAVQNQDVDAFLALYANEATSFRGEDFIKHLVDAVLLHALAQPADIDTLLVFLAKVAHKLTERVQADTPADNPADAEFARQEEARRGGQAVVNRTVERLVEAVKAHLLREVTPQPEDAKSWTATYWHLALVHGIVLARFATAVYGASSADELEDLSQVASQGAKDKLWEEALTPLLGRTVLSQSSWPEPAALVMALAVLQGAADTLAKELKPKGQRVGRGVNWLWYSNEYNDPKKEWDLVEVVRATQEGIDGKYADQFKLPSGLIDGFVQVASSLGQLEERVTQGKAESSKSFNRSAPTLVNQTFQWIAEQPAQGTEAGLAIERAALLVDVNDHLGGAFKKQHDHALRGAGTSLRTGEELQGQIQMLTQLSEQNNVPIYAFDIHDRLQAAKE